MSTTQADFRTEDLGLLRICETYSSSLPIDFGGGAPLSKMLFMSYLVRLCKLRSFLEIGVYHGRSFLPTAHHIALQGGRSLGVDPYRLDCALEYDLEEGFRDKVNSFLRSLDFEQIFSTVSARIRELPFSDSVSLLRQSSSEAGTVLLDSASRFDFIHIDGNHDSMSVERDFEFSLSVLDDGGFLLFDDINWPSVATTYCRARQSMLPVFESEGFGLLQKGEARTRNKQQTERLRKKLGSLYEKIQPYDFEPRSTPLISVGVLCYNHVGFIAQCLDSVRVQTGDFRLRIVIVDDCSTDGTSEYIQELLSAWGTDGNLSIKYIRNEQNMGMVASFAELIGEMKGSDYFSLCDGDDYYSSSDRLAEHLQLHRLHPETAISFNRVKIIREGEGGEELWRPGEQHSDFCTETLIAENFIGNLSAGFYCSSVLNHLHPNLFDCFTGDWLFNIFCSQFGEIKLLDKALSVYRKHRHGIWSAVPMEKQFRSILASIDRYNAVLDFAYDREFTAARNRRAICLNGIPVEKPDLLIIDDVFPHPLSGFRYQEFSSLLTEFPNAKIVTTGESLHCLGKETREEILSDFKTQFPQFAGQVQAQGTFSYQGARLLYGTFLGNAHYNILPRAEEMQVPFAFTLYPGGAFGLDNERSDGLLRRTLDSPLFRKVIVTQKITEDYLLRKQFCGKEQIVSLFGVVVPLEKLHLSNGGKRHFGFDKDTFDICFVAHKYTQFGEDKGYGVFLDTARELMKRGSSYHFHVVGPFDETVLDASDIANLHFYGSRPQDWFDTFYLDKDAIVSPNVPFRIFPGNFDGFPTGCVTDASLRRVAMFCTDPLGINDAHYVDGEEIVIIQPDGKSIADELSYYAEHPERLKELGESGCRRSRELYSYEKQIAPRVEVLRELIGYGSA